VTKKSQDLCAALERGRGAKGMDDQVQLQGVIAKS